MSGFIPSARPLVGDEECAAVDRVLRSGSLAQGPEVAQFEREFAAHFALGRPCVAVNSGTSGLHVGLLASGVGPGDEVIVPSFTFAAHRQRGRPRRGARRCSPTSTPTTSASMPRPSRQAVTERTVGDHAGAPVRAPRRPAVPAGGGRPSRPAGLRGRRPGARGLAARHARSGAFGTFGMFSLYPTKNMTSGEGGMVAVGDPEVERLLRVYRNQGMEQPVRERGGRAERPDDRHPRGHRAGAADEVAAGPGGVRTTRPFWTPSSSGVTVPTVAEGAVHVYHQYTVRVPEDRDGFAAALEREHRIGSGIYYPVPVHRLAPFRTRPTPTCPRPNGPRASASRCRCTRRSRTGPGADHQRGQRPRRRRRLRGRTSPRRGRARARVRVRRRAARGAIRGRPFVSEACSGGLLGLPEDLGDLVDLGEELVGLGHVARALGAGRRRPAWSPR